MPDKIGTAPNLLFLYTDEQRADTMRAYGNAKIRTPNLDRLAEQSTVFERTYVTQPVCTPSRSSLLTGLMPHTNGCVANNVPLPSEVRCVPEMLPDGYVCAHHGKWHLGDEIYPQHGFGEWRAVEDMYVPHYSASRDRDDRSHYHHWLAGHGHRPDIPDGRFSRGFCARLPEEYCKPRYLATEASRFIRENREHPWALFVNFLEPHMPFSSCRDGQYDPAEVDLPPNFDDVTYAAARERVLAAQVRDGHWKIKTEADWRALIARYWGLCSLVDTYVGRILEAVSECDLDERTIVVFTSDHGDMMGSHRLLTKGVMYEEAVRVPLLLRAPGQAAGRRISEPVSQIDVVPTLLDMMGVEPLEHLEGRSLRPVVEDGEKLERDVLVEWNGRDGAVKADRGQMPPHLRGAATAEESGASFADPVRTIVTPDRWKLCCSPLGEHRLCDLNADPYERKNLFGEPAHRERANDLLGRIKEWQSRTGDRVALPESLG